MDEVQGRKLGCKGVWKRRLKLSRTLKRNGGTGCYLKGRLAVGLSEDFSQEREKREKRRKKRRTLWVVFVFSHCVEPTAFVGKFMANGDERDVHRLSVGACHDKLKGRESGEKREESKYWWAG